METKQRLKREFGLYAKNWEEPFTLSQLCAGFPMENKQVRMIAADAPGPAREAPKAQKAFMNKMVNEIKAPEFSGDEADFADFAREWQQYLRVMCPGGTAEVSDALILGMLKKALDHVSCQKLISAMESNPNLTYANFCKMLELDFGRDLTGVYRKEWDKVTLGGARNLTPKLWRQFEAEFELKARRVGDVTDREKEDRIKLELPQDLRHRLAEENLRVSSTRHWVKIPEPLPIPVDRLEMFLARVMGKPAVHMEHSGQAY